MNFLEVTAVSAAACNLVITGLILRNNYRSVASWANAAWGAAFIMWNIGAARSYSGLTEPEALFWIKFLQCGVIFMPVTLLHVCLLTAEVPAKWWVRGLYVLHGLYALSLLTDWFVADVKELQIGYFPAVDGRPMGYWMVPGPLFWVFLASYAATTTTLVTVLARAQSRAAGLKRTRIRFLLAAVFGLWIFGTNDLLPIIGIDRYPIIDAPFLPLGNLTAIGYSMLVGYSALQHSLLDVHVRLGRVSAHIVRFTFLLVIGLVLQLGVVLVAPGEFTAVSFSTTLLVLLTSSALASVLFPRLFGNTGMENLERRILGDRFEYQDQVRSFIERMNLSSNLPSLLDDLHILLTRTFRLERYRIILRDESNYSFVITRAFPEMPRRTLAGFGPDAPVFRYFESGRGEYLSLNREYVRAGATLLEKQSRAQLDHLECEFCFPLAWQQEPFGLLLIGNKIGMAPFTATDVNLLIALAKNLSLVINQLRLKTQVLQSQELDLLGRMSRGMAHDLNNLLTPVSTLLQLADESGHCDEELLPTAMRNLATMRAYIKESLFFSEHPKPDLGLGRLDAVIQQTVELARSTRKKQVDIIAETPSEVLVEMNEVLIQRLLTNIISNAIDASAPGTCIRVHLESLPRTEPTREWLRIQVIDQGEGISQENLERVQIPYFTTKNRGDETRGFGLGLAICRKIVTLHGGRLSIESQLRKGTTVQVDLPNRQLTAERLSLLSLPTPA